MKRFGDPKKYYFRFQFWPPWPHSAIEWFFHTKSLTNFLRIQFSSKLKTNLMKTQRGALLNTKTKSWDPKQKSEKFFENKKVRQLFQFSYKTAKTPKSRNAFASCNTWILRLKIFRRYHNEPYYWLFAITIGTDTIQTPY